MRTIGFLSVLLLLLEARSQNNGLALNNAKPASFHSVYNEVDHSAEVNIAQLFASKSKGKAVLGKSSNGLPVEAYFFPGTSDKKALVIAGVHGSELSSIDIARLVIAQLETGAQPYYNVVIIPELFPDNARKAALRQDNKTNYGRYTSAVHVDPNRQMPALSRSFNEQQPLDALGRPIELENTYLLRLIQEYQPSRIINLHAIKDETKGGIYADPRTDCQGIAKGFHSDEALALQMAHFVSAQGGNVPGNMLQQKETALYHNDPQPVPAGHPQPRNLVGSKLVQNRGAGVSLGSWATTDVCDGLAPRTAARLITVEFPGYRSYTTSGSYKDRQSRFLNTYLFAMAVSQIFLDNYQCE